MTCAWAPRAMLQAALGPLGCRAHAGQLTPCSTLHFLAHLQALLRSAASQRRASSSSLHVAADNVPALALYRRVPSECCAQQAARQLLA
jgi:hypothetical protein